MFLLTLFPPQTTSVEVSNANAMLLSLNRINVGSGNVVGICERTFEVDPSHVKPSPWIRILKSVNATLREIIR